MSRGQTGLGTTIGLSTDGQVGLVQSCQMPSWDIESIDFTNLDDSEWMVFQSGILKNPGQMLMQLYFDSEGALPTMGSVQVATVTFPIFVPATNSNDPPAADTGTLIGSGFLNQHEFPNTSINEAMMMSLGWQFDGLSSPPALTPGTPTVLLAAKVAAGSAKKTKV